jgi:hypothetical protein
MNRRQVLIGGGAVAGAALVGFGVGTAGMGSMADYEAATAAVRSRSGQAVPDLIRMATLAANSHNTQPWQFHVGDRRIAIRPDFVRRTPVVDPDDHHLFASLGCAAENLVIAAAAAGHPGEARFDPAGDGSVVFDYTDGAPASSPLVEAITRRQSTRAEYDARPIPAADLAVLAAAASVPGVDLFLLIDAQRIGDVSDLIVAGNDAQMADAAYIVELKHWLRFNPRQAMATADGLFSATNGNPSLPAWLGPRLFDFVATAASEGKKYAAQVRSSAGVAIFVSERNDPEHWMHAGRACQRFALQATALGLKHAFVNQAVEVPAVRGQLAAYLGVGERRPDLVMRFGYGPEMPRSLRRPVEQVVFSA